MRCPYCAEDVREEAAACKHCGRDLLFIRPLVWRLRDLEGEIEALTRHVDALHSANGGAWTRPTRVLPARILAAIGFVLLAAFPLNLLAESVAGSAVDVLHHYANAMPFFVGIWLGSSVVGRHSVWYATIGVLLGAASFAAYGVAANEAPWDMGVPWLVSGALATLAGGLFGDWIEYRRRGVSVQGLPKDLARRVLHPSGSRYTRLEQEERVQRLTLTFSVLEFLVALVAAIATFPQLFAAF